MRAAGGSGRLVAGGRRLAVRERRNAAATDGHSARSKREHGCARGSGDDCAAAPHRAQPIRWTAAMALESYLPRTARRRCTRHDPRTRINRHASRPARRTPLRRGCQRRGCQHRGARPASLPLPQWRESNFHNPHFLTLLAADSGQGRWSRRRMAMAANRRIPRPRYCVRILLFWWLAARRHDAPFVHNRLQVHVMMIQFSSNARLID